MRVDACATMSIFENRQFGISDENEMSAVMEMLVLCIAAAASPALAYGGGWEPDSESVPSADDDVTIKKNNGVTVGVLVGVAVVLIVAWLYFRRRKKQREREREPPVRLNSVLRRKRRPSSTNISGCVFHAWQ